ncbi:hypothetical protein D7V86_01405 [bacterium D16-51]|nr:hypothetical protein D7V96_03915 [bacterium D16-59]RKI62884.1 hypothetical protein D7V86_01405 [bacterium D16-51]
MILNEFYSREGKVRMCKQACIIRACPRGSNTPPLWGELAKGKLGHAPLLCSGVFDSKSLQETLQEFDLTDVEIHTTDSGKIASIELKYSEKPAKEEEKPRRGIQYLGS